jgi:hypothetical protein
VDEGPGGVPGREVTGWDRRPFARSFDLLSSEYGWTDDQILDLTMERIRQCRDVILERKVEDHKRDLRVKELEVQRMTAYIAGAAGWKDGVKNAGRFELYERTPEDRPLPSYERLTKLFGG